ncbi:MAG: MbnP family protein [Saprospiraceae bacterium]
MKYILILLITVGFGACTKEQDASAVTGSVTFSFNANYGIEAFQPVKAYTYGSKQTIKFSKLDFYITGIELLNNTGSTSSDVAALIDLTSSNPSGSTITIPSIKAGSYSGLRFMLGVKSDLNKKLPKDFPSTSALANTSHYWEAWNSFIFSKIEGVIDVENNGNFDLGFAIHTGTDDCLQKIEISKSFEVTENGNIPFLFDMDVQKIFFDGTSMFDLVSSPLNHNPVNLEVLKSFSARMAQSIQLKN